MSTEAILIIMLVTLSTILNAEDGERFCPLCIKTRVLSVILTKCEWRQMKPHKPEELANLSALTPFPDHESAFPARVNAKLVLH